MLQKQEVTPKIYQPKRRNQYEVTEVALSKSLADCDELFKKAITDDKDEDSLYCCNLIPIIRDLPNKKGD